MSTKEVLDQISNNLGQLLSKAKGNQQAIATINEMMINVFKLTEQLAKEE